MAEFSELDKYFKLNLKLCLQDDESGVELLIFYL